MTTTSAAPSVNDMVTPERFLDIAQGFMASKHLFAASELGLFEALGLGHARFPISVGARRGDSL